MEFHIYGLPVIFFAGAVVVGGMKERMGTSFRMTVDRMFSDEGQVRTGVSTKIKDATQMLSISTVLRIRGLNEHR